MSIPFAKTKSQTLELTTFLDFGKYKDCRVDSIIEQDHEYLQYLRHNKIRPLAPSVINALENKFSSSCIEVTIPKDMKFYPDSFDYVSRGGFFSREWDDDVPF